MAVDSHVISSYFERINWTHRIVDDTRVTTRYRCPIAFYYYPVAIEVVTNKYWVIMRTLLQRDVDKGQVDAVLRYITQWNAEIYSLRLILVQDCVLLQGEIPTRQCHIGTFMDMLSASCQYSGLAGVEIAMLATNPSAAALYMKVAASVAGVENADMGMDDEPDLNFNLSLNVLPMMNLSASVGEDRAVQQAVQSPISSEVG